MRHEKKSSTTHSKQISVYSIMPKKSRENYIDFRRFRSGEYVNLPYIIVKKLVLQHRQGTVIISIQSEAVNLSFLSNP